MGPSYTEDLGKTQDQSQFLNKESQKLTNKLEERRKQKRQNKFDRVSLGKRIESVKKLRSESKALTGDLEGLKLALGKSQISKVKPDSTLSKSILSKVR